MEKVAGNVFLPVECVLPCVNVTDGHDIRIINGDFTPLSM